MRKPLSLLMAIVMMVTTSVTLTGCPQQPQPEFSVIVKIAGQSGELLGTKHQVVSGTTIDAPYGVLIENCGEHVTGFSVAYDYAKTFEDTDLLWALIPTVLHGAWWITWEIVEATMGRPGAPPLQDTQCQAWIIPMPETVEKATVHFKAPGDKDFTLTLTGLGEPSGEGEGEGSNEGEGEEPTCDVSVKGQINIVVTPDVQYVDVDARFDSCPFALFGCDSGGYYVDEAALFEQIGVRICPNPSAGETCNTEWKQYVQGNLRFNLKPQLGGAKQANLFIRAYDAQNPTSEADFGTPACLTNWIVTFNGIPVPTPPDGRIPVTVPDPTDTTAPVVSLIGATNVTVQCGDVWNDPGASATDNDSNVSNTIEVIGSVNSTEPGEYHLIYEACDVAGNCGEAERIVNVIDDVAPMITLAGPSSITLALGTPFTDPGASATDSCEGVVDAVPSGVVNVNVAGSYTRTYTANDGNGNVATATRTIVVQGAQCSQRPVITLAGPSSITLALGTPFTDPGASATDPCNNGGTVTVAAGGNVNVNVAGTYTRTYTATNANGTTTATRTVIVQEAAPTAPTITSQPVSASREVGATVTFTVAATGTAPLSYQWQKGGANINGATGPSLTIPMVGVGDAGNYRVVVTNPAGTATSNVATLTVTSPPQAGAELRIQRTSSTTGRASLIRNGNPFDTLFWGLSGTPTSVATIQWREGQTYPNAMRFAGTSNTSSDTMTWEFPWPAGESLRFNVVTPPGTIAEYLATVTPTNAIGAEGTLKYGNPDTIACTHVQQGGTEVTKFPDNTGAWVIVE